MKPENTKETLFKIFSNVNDWLKFAEAKNAMLIAFNGASIYGVVRALNLAAVKETDWLSIYLFITIVLFVFSTAIALISFVPRVKIIHEGVWADESIKNMLFFEHLKGMQPDEVLKEVSGSAGEDKFSRLETDLAGQIIQNAKIASRKYSHFTIAVWVTIAGYITPVLAFIFWLFTYKRN